MRANPDDHYSTDRLGRPPIAAEASSEYLREPTYEELWRSRFPAAPPESARKARNVGARSLATIIAILMGVMALIGMRERIVRFAPAVAGAYAALGLPVNVAGLELRGVHSRMIMEGARKVLAIEGEIVNLRKEANAIPSLSLAVRGADGQDKYAWTARAPKPKLERGETVAFRARLASPPENGTDVFVRFAGAEEVGREKAASPTLR
jgi:hypothetical protein